MEPTERDRAVEEKESGGLLRRKGLKLAFTAPAVLAALHAGVASADGSHSDDDHSDDDNDDGRSGQFGRIQNAFVTLPLSRVGDTSGGDFGGSNTDALTRGWVQVRGVNGGSSQVFVSITGSDQHNATYKLQFYHANDNGREDIGTFTTNSNGNFQGQVGTPLSNHHRVGVFVIQRDNTDRYVTSVNL